MNSEESFNPYHELYGASMATQWDPDGIPSMFCAQTIESPPITKKYRAILIVPTMFLSFITVLFGVMLFWLFYRHAPHANIDPSVAFVADGALIVDEAAQWCQLLAILPVRANCSESIQAQNLLGLTLSGLLVSQAIRSTYYFLMTYTK